MVDVALKRQLVGAAMADPGRMAEYAADLRGLADLIDKLAGALHGSAPASPEPLANGVHPPGKAERPARARRSAGEDKPTPRRKSADGKPALKVRVAELLAKSGPLRIAEVAQKLDADPGQTGVAIRTAPEWFVKTGPNKNDPYEVTATGRAALSP